MPSPELGGGYEAARVHNARWRCGGCMADFSVGAAGLAVPNSMQLLADALID
jgi:hypothetical protein